MLCQKYMTIAVYAGSFDPPTRGHLDLIQRVSPLFEKLFVVVAQNTTKSSLFSAAERVEMLLNSLQELDCKNIEVKFHEGLVVNFCKKVNAKVFIRGIRAVSDFEKEFQIASMNRSLDPNIETLHIMPDQKFSFISSSLIKEVAHFGGDLSEFVTPTVEAALKKKITRG